MKHAKNIVLIAIAMATVVYLVGAFYSVSFNIATWAEGDRGSCVVAFAIGSFLGITFYGVSQSDY